MQSMGPASVRTRISEEIGIFRAWKRTISLAITICSPSLEPHPQLLSTFGLFRNPTANFGKIFRKSLRQANGVGDMV